MLDLNEFRFKGQPPEEWCGRYSRIPGPKSVFRLKSVHKHYGFWPIIEHTAGEETGLCLACETNNLQPFIESINSVKKTYTGKRGGAFQINEYGQVLVPIYDSYYNMQKVFLVGEVTGTLLFKSPITNEIIDLSNDEGLKLGSIWDKPYIGIPYNLSQRNKIYHKNRNGIVRPLFEDKELIKKIRMLRRWGPVRFIVNPHGIVLMKNTSSEYDPDIDENWIPYYVGRINYDQWFLKGE